MQEVLNQKLGWFLIPMVKWLNYRESYPHQATISSGIVSDSRACEAFRVYAPTIQDAISAVLTVIAQTSHRSCEDWLEFKVSVKGLELDEKEVRKLFFSL